MKDDTTAAPSVPEDELRTLVRICATYGEQALCAAVVTAITEVRVVGAADVLRKRKRGPTTHTVDFELLARLMPDQRPGVVTDTAKALGIVTGKLEGDSARSLISKARRDPYPATIDAEDEVRDQHREQWQRHDAVTDEVLATAMAAAEAEIDRDVADGARSPEDAAAARARLLALPDSIHKRVNAVQAVAAVSRRVNDRKAQRRPGE